MTLLAAPNAITRPDDRPHCADPDLLPIVDLAFDKPGSPAGQHMRDLVCPGCPVGDSCLAYAMTSRQFGIWGGSSTYQRTSRGAPGSPATRAARKVG